MHHESLSKEYPDDDHGIVVVIDGDGDSGATSELVSQLAAKHEIGVIAYDKNRGRGHALRLGFLTVASHLETSTANSTNVIAYTDADGSYSTATLSEMYGNILNGSADLSVAYRSKDQSVNTESMKVDEKTKAVLREYDHVAIHGICERIATKVDEKIKAVLREYGHVAIHGICERIATTGQVDPQAGAKAFRGDIVKPLWSQVITERWAADREVLHLANKFNLETKGVEADIESAEDSTVRILRDTRDMIRDSYRIRQSHGSAVAPFDLR
jgi:hypothetical protein